jgi:glucose/arabinose dehydrogenase
MSDRRADSRSGQVLIEIDQPASNHNGGYLTYGPDGFLYVGVGDGGNQGDPDGNGQDTKTLLASILRIDPDGSDGELDYSIPPGNPFDGENGLREIWLYGVRNPWRFSFDAATGDLWIADVGGSQEEEINWLPSTEANQNPGRGANLGWSLVEGNAELEGEAPDGAVSPLFTYTHDDGDCSVTGGFVYRGAAIPAMQGVYLFGDFCKGVIRGIVQKEGVLVEEGPLQATVPNLSSFGVDQDGEMYALSLDGQVFKINAGPVPPGAETTTTPAPPPPG